MLASTKDMCCVRVTGSLKALSGRTATSRFARMRGQAFILGIIALVVLCIGVLVLFNTGQVVNKKVQLVNTADAAAYSAAVQQARAYNLIAYMNRATVANEIAMAQMVSWYSWTNFGISGADHTADMLYTISAFLEEFGIGEVLDVIAAALERGVSVLKKVRKLEQKLFDLGATVVAGMNGLYSDVSLLISDGGSFDAANLTRKIVKMNDPDAQIPASGIGLLLFDAFRAKGYISRYKTMQGKRPQGGDRLRNVVMESRDPFSRKRNVSYSIPLPVPDVSLAFKKNGGTDLVDYRNWVGVDTFNFAFSCTIFGLCKSPFSRHGIHFTVPLAWGGAAAVDKQSMSFKSLALDDPGWDGPYAGNGQEYPGEGHYDAYSGAVANGWAGKIALSNPADGGTPWIKPFGSSLIKMLHGTVGLPDYDDIADDRASVPYLNGHSAADNGVKKLDVGPVFTVFVVQKMETVHTSDHVDHLGNDPASATSGIFGGAPDFRVKDKAVSKRLSAMSSAQVYFSRSKSLFPNPVDPRREMGSLFSPYWQARLVDTSCSTRQLIAMSNKAISPCLP